MISRITPTINALWNALRTDTEPAMKILFWLRDPRGGLGQRELFRALLRRLANNDELAPWVSANITSIPVFGRWDDIHVLRGSTLDVEAVKFLSNSLDAPLCAKWMPRRGKVFAWVRDYLGVTNRELRTILVNHTDVVETMMCNKQWADIDLQTVPSISRDRYTSAFITHGVVNNVKSNKFSPSTLMFDAAGLSGEKGFGKYVVNIVS